MPKEVKDLAEVVFRYREEDKGLLEVLGEMGWRRVSVSEHSGSWWMRRGGVEALVVFGGPFRDAHCHTWRYVNG